MKPPGMVNMSRQFSRAAAEQPTIPFRIGGLGLRRCGPRDLIAGPFIEFHDLRGK